jgi:uncharacterized protein YjbI with pentapeptide repeats
MPDICEYVFNPDEWDEKHRSESSLEETWECPHPTHVDTEYCVFHLEPERRELLGVTESDVRDELMRSLERAETQQEARFVGATFPETVVVEQAIAENEAVEEVDLQHSVFNGRFDISDAVIEASLKLDCTEFESFSAPNTVFEGDVSFRECSFDGDVNLSGATFEGDVSFKRVSFSQVADFSETAFEGDVDLRYSTYTGVDTTFQDANFAGEALVSGVTFDEANFTGADFAEDTDFSNTTFRGETKFQYADFEGYADFKSTDFTDNSTFRGVDFLDGTTFNDASFQGWVTFLNVEFERDSDFSDAWFKRDLNIVAESEGNVVLDFSNARVGKGSFETAPYDPVVFDFTGARVGNVSLSVGDSGKNPFDYARFVETSFNGFDFADYADDLADMDYEIHGSVIQSDEELDLPRLEKTYRLASDGAKGNHEGIASKFADKEAAYRRERHRGEGNTLEYVGDLVRDYGVYAVVVLLLLGGGVAAFLFRDALPI